MKQLNLLVAIFAICLLSSCSGFIYQVYDVRSDLKQEGKSLVYSNDECELTYDLWDEGGNLSFLVTNKTDKDMFVVLPQSFFIRNGIACDFYVEGSESNSKAVAVSSTTTNNAAISGYLERFGKWYPVALGASVGTTAKVVSTKTHTTVNPKIICIPARSTKYVTGFTISDYVYKDCDNPKENYPSKQSSTINYTKANSPMVFRNRIAYTFDLEDSKYQYIDNEFYVSSLTNYNQRVALEKTVESVCESNMKVKSKRFTVSAPNRFYNKYLKKSVSSVGVYNSHK